MTAVLVGNWEPGSPEWHAARHAGLGGSEIAAVLGLSPFESRFGLWHRKHGDLGPQEQTPEMEWGSRLEEAIARKFLDEHPEYSDEGQRGMWRHPARPWQISNPDRLLYTPRDDGDVDLAAILETKFSVMGDGWGEPGTEDVPPHVWCQVQWYLDVFDLELAHVAVLVGGCDYREYTLKRDPEQALELRGAAAEFLDHVDLHIRPDIDEHAATYQAIKELHPEIDGTETELSPVTAQFYIDAKTFEKRAKAHAREATARVADEMGTAHRAMWDGRPIARRQVRDGGHPYVVAARGLTNGDDDPAETWVDPHTGETF